MIDELAHRVTIESIERRSAAGRRTGEWIVFAKAQGQNYYLCLATHEASDEQTFDRIATHCIRDFPELMEWLQAD
jgi:hypothetical protein